MNRILSLGLMLILTAFVTATQSFAQQTSRKIDPKTVHNTKNHKCVITITGTVTNLTCNGDNSGGIDITVTHTKGQVSYLWSDGSTDEDREGLTAGTYSVTVSDETKRTATASFTVTEPTPIVVTPVITPASAPGECDGSVILDISGGNPLYSITWNDGGTGTCRKHLCPGNYKVCVTDSNGCSAVTKVTIPAGSSFSLSAGSASSIVSKDVVRTSVSPNPTSGAVQLNFTAKATGTAAINVYDMNGKKVSTEKFAVAEGSNIKRVDLGRYSKGLYHVELLVDGKKQLVKVLVQ